MRAFLERFRLRERLLMGLLVWLVGLTWLFVQGRSYGQLSRQLASVQAELDFQAVELADAELVAVQLEEARERIDPSQTRNGDAMFEAIDTFARQSGLNGYTTSTITVTPGELFTFYTMRLNVRQAELSTLIAFDEALKQASPYVTMTQFNIRASNRDPRRHDATFEIQSFQVNDQALQ